MKLIKNWSAILFLLSSALISEAQTVQKEMQESFMLFPSVNTNSWRGYNGISDSESNGDKVLNKVAVSLDKGTIATLGGKGIIAVDQDGVIKWNVDIKGMPMAMGRCKNQLIAFSVPSIHGPTQAYSNELNAFIIEPSTGKILLQKSINAGDATYIEQALFFLAEDGSFCKIGLRLSNRKKAIDLTLYNKYLQQFGQTQSFTLFDLDDKLERKNETKLALPMGGFGGALCNSKGEIFVRTIPFESTVCISQFVSGNSKPVKTLSQNINPRKKQINTKFLVSKSNPSVAYVASLYEDSDKEIALNLSKLNFATGKVENKKEYLTKAGLKDLEKKYKPVNAKWDKSDLGRPEDMQLMELEEHGDQLFTTLSAMVRVTSPNMIYDDVHSILLNGYNLDLKIQSQNIIPRFYNSTYGYGLGLHREKDLMRFIANDHAGRLSNKALYGELDLKTGQITKLNYLEKSKIEKGNPIDPATVIWYPTGFISGYMNLKGIAGRMVGDIQVCKY